MNATVVRIVDLLFENLAPTEEVCTLHDEVMANCQARYNDGINRGLTEDEAISTVIESLKGMEVILDAYPKRGESLDEEAPKQQTYTYHREGNDSNYAFSPAQVQALKVNLVSHDIHIDASFDGMIHVDVKDNPRVKAAMEGSTLVVKLEQQATPHMNKRSMDFTSFGTMLSSFFQNVQASVNSLEGDVTIRLPVGLKLPIHAATTSGDISLRYQCSDRLILSTVSGDIDANFAHQIPAAELNTASGDITAIFPAKELKISTMSGDIDYAGDVSNAQLSTVSGDMELKGVLHGELKSVSGGINLLTEGGTLNVKTTSGDVYITAEGDVSTVHAELKSVSGYTVTGHGFTDLGDRSQLFIRASSVSGNLNVNSAKLFR